MVDFELYRIFIVVADNKNITRASEELNISQPAVTKRIKNLEDLLNVKLFERSKEGMKLTQNGEKLYRETIDSVRTLNLAERLFISRKEIKVGTRVTIYSKLFSNVIKEYYERFPQIDIKAEYLYPQELIDKLVNQSIDIGLYREGPIENSNIKNKIRYIKLGELEDVFFVNSNYYKRINKVFTKEDLKKEIIYLSHKTSFRYKNLVDSLGYSEKEKENLKTIRNTVMLEMIKNENIIGTISKEFIQKEIDDGTFKILKTDFSLPKTGFGIYYNKNNKFKELDEFIKIIKKEFDS